MEIIIFLYNIFLIALYTVCLSFSVLNYLHKKKPLFFIIAVLFLSYICDNTIIYMTEYLEEFSLQYDLQFMTVPAFKTAVVLTDSFCMAAVLRLLFPNRRHGQDIVGLILLGLALLFIPMASNGAMKVWLYYLPFQIFTFYLSLSGILYLRKHPAELDQEMSAFKWILRTTLVFSVLILIEDTIVIFSFDVYSDLVVKINNRSLSEDIMSIIFSIFALAYLSRQLRQPVIESLGSSDGEVAQASNDTPESVVYTDADSVSLQKEAGDAQRLSSRRNKEDFSTQPQVPGNGAPSDQSCPLAVGDISRPPDTAFLHFVNHYQLTSREQDILRILLMDKNNQEISAALCISIGTVKTHVHNIFQKVNVTKRSQLLTMYYEYQKNSEWEQDL